MVAISGAEDAANSRRDGDSRGFLREIISDVDLCSILNLDQSSKTRMKG
jgi:hypothetical protein